MTPERGGPEASGSGRAHGKAILMGEHAVVYGFPAIALPLLPVTVDATVQLSIDADWLDCAYYRGPLAKAPSELGGLRVLIEESRRALGSPSRGTTVHIDSMIPPEYGLGSSAAVAVAIVRAMYDLFHQTLAAKELASLVHVAEVHAHGSPSGIDAWAASVDSALWFVPGQPPDPLPLSRPLFLVVAGSDTPGNTRDAVRRVKESQARFGVGAGPIARIGELTRAARPALVRGDYGFLGALMTEAHRELNALHVATDHLNRLVSTALRDGALGAKLTGGGGGGSMMALAADGSQQMQLAETLRRTGARQVWTPVVGGS